ncbi:F0F1 ATP synthase subunit B' [Epibacterium sp. SM1979]|uniref:ATP synthase subunit b n=1 Tax=Tritonibacter litoralis TaxID=2662264 RepID=A0A843YCG6_9RHOB|nr:F0F1 ATP synthase subunit B' [Tritonibacter litoralis]MQQ08641.1 F0F1 ATP synthase subunit B' [Tritonibacter litoralis]
MASNSHDAGHGAADAAHGAADAAHHAADAAHGSGGMPQLDFSTYGNQIFWLLVTLVVIYFILSRIALPRIAAVLAERQGTITNDLAAAEDLKAKAVEAEDAYNKALADARGEAQKIAAETRAAIQKDLDAAIAKADEEIAAKAAESEKALAEIKEGALEAVKVVAADTASALVSALGGQDDADAVSASVAERMKG